MGIATQSAGVLSVTMGRGVSTMSSYVVYDADGLVPVGHELVTSPLTDEWTLQPARVCRGAGVSVLPIYSPSQT